MCGQLERSQTEEAVDLTRSSVLADGLEVPLDRADVASRDGARDRLGDFL